MKYVKLFLISIVVFSVMLFCLSLVFPSTTYVSRAVNVNIITEPKAALLPQLYQLAFKDGSNTIGAIQGQNQPATSDTLMLPSQFSTNVFEGVALYNAGVDSNTVQVFYKIHVPFYKPWQKFALMLNETKYGPSLDSAISRISKKF